MSEPCLKTNYSENPEEYAAYIIETYGCFIRTVIQTQNTTQIPEDDLFQDFYLALISKPVPENVRDIKGYIYKAIIHHLADSCIRLHNYEKKIKKFRKFYDFKAPQIDPKSALLIKEETDNMFEYFKEILPGQKYAVIELRYKEGYNIKEIADKMGIKYSSVKKYLSKGISKVRQCLINT